MPKFVAGLALLSLTCGPCAFAQSTASATDSNFPSAAYLQVPPHFQPRPLDAAHKIGTPPPPIPSYAQSAIPAEGYLWMPGFWARREDVRDYYWVPGTWVKPPRAGLLWTPPYWSRAEGGFVFHPGYWAQAVGFYGGIDYGYGYTGDGYQGGRWDNGTFLYNRAANNLGSVRVAHAYDQAIAADNTSAKASFNGDGGANARPTSQQEAAERDVHVAPTVAQQEHFEMAAKDRALYSKLNHGEPGIAATVRAGVLNGSGIIRSSAWANDATLTNDTGTTTGTNRK
jgi:YXWGXW repeat-containing protein